MSLTLGTNAYTTLADFKTWCDLFDLDYSSFSNSKIEGAIALVSLTFIEPNYTFKGTKLDSDQPMQLPTDEVTIADAGLGVNQAVWQQLNGQLLVDLSTIDVGGQVIMERKKLDKLEKEVEYAEGGRKTNTISTTRINALLNPYIVYGSAGGMGEVRVL